MQKGWFERTSSCKKGDPVSCQKGCYVYVFVTKRVVAQTPLLQLLKGRFKSFLVAKRVPCPCINSDERVHDITTLFAILHTYVTHVM